MSGSRAAAFITLHGRTLVLAAIWFALALFFLVPQIQSLRGPLVGEHDWRQADTYSVAYNYVHVSSNFFFPRIDMTNGRSGVQGMETPLYPYLLSLLMRVFGDAPAVGRTFTCAVGLVGLVHAAVWLRPRGSSMWMVWPLALVSSPMYLYELRQIQPDPAMCGFAAISAAHLTAFRRDERWRSFAWGWLFAAATALTKAPGVLLLPVLWTFAWPEGRFRFWRWLGTGVALASPAALSFGWYKWGQHLNTAYNAGEVYFAAEFSWPAIKADLANQGNLIRLFDGVCTTYAVHWMLLPVALAGFALGFKPGHLRTTLSMTFWLAIWTVFCAGFSGKLWWHWYYASPLAVPIGYFVAVAFYEAFGFERTSSSADARNRDRAAALVVIAASFWLATFVGGPPLDPHHTPGAGGDILAGLGTWGWVQPINVWVLLATLVLAAGFSRVPAFASRRVLLTAVAVAGMAVGWQRYRTDATNVLAWRARTDLWPHFARSVSELRAACDRFSTRADGFVVDFGENPVGLHRAMRRGFVEPPERIDAHGVAFFRQHGIRFLVHFVEAERRPALATSLPRLASGDGWELYCVDDRGCLPR